jgi:hypothetical protein
VRHSSKPLKLLTWNVGTSFKHIRQAYPVTQFNKVVRHKSRGDLLVGTHYDIICLQEVPVEPIPIATGGKCISVKSFGAPWLRHYALFTTPRGNNSLVTLVRKDLVASNTHRALAIGTNNAFSHGIALKCGWVFNVHLKANPSPTSVLIRREQVKGLAAHLPHGPCILAGDFNVTPTHLGSGRAGTLSGYLPGFKCLPATTHTYECQVSKVLQKLVYDYIAVLGRPPAPPNYVVATPKWGSPCKHRHFPVAADVVL